MLVVMIPVVIVQFITLSKPSIVGYFVAFLAAVVAHCLILLAVFNIVGFSVAIGPKGNEHFVIVCFVVLMVGIFVIMLLFGVCVLVMCYEVMIFMVMTIFF